MTPPGRVYLIGTGPGDPGLISARGARLLSEADVVVYDRAVEAQLRWADADAERIAAGAPAEAETAQDAISILLAEKAREGHVVARLKWGDPFLFDSGAREALFLHEQGVTFEVVPGIPTAIGATAYAGVPITYPGAGDAVVLLRGFEFEGDSLPDVDWHAVARIDGTIAAYLGDRQVPRVLDALLKGGLAPDTSATLIYDGTQPRQTTVTGSIQELAASTAAEPANRPATLVVGRVTRLRDHLRWFDERPLFGRRIIVTRSAEQARGLVDRLETLGAQAIEAPTFRVMPPEDPESVDRAAASLAQYQWLIFESANAVLRFVSALMRGPRDLRAFGSIAIGAIGPSTEEALSQYGLKADVVIPEFGGASIGDALTARGPISGQRVLVVRPDHHRTVRAEDLMRHGASVSDLVAYRTTSAPQDSPIVQGIYRLMLENRVDAVTFTSPTAVSRFTGMLGEEQAADLLNTTVVAAVGPVTAAAARAHGIRTTVIADTHTVDGLVAALVRHFAG
jgi:uroporphyrinogen III methyltransferase/synthase